MSYNLTQNLVHISQENWEDEITAELPDGEFIAITAISYNEEAGQRKVRVQIMSLPGAPAGVHTTNTGLYFRPMGEKSVKATLYDTYGKEVDSNVTDYP